MVAYKQQGLFGSNCKRHFRLWGSQSEADPCLYYCWDEQGDICIWLTWIDDCAAIGKESVVMRMCKIDEFVRLRYVGGPMEEYIGNKIKIRKCTMKLMQPVLL
jgi:hypothetical protein